MLRRERGLTLGQVGLGAGLSTGFLSDFERGRVNASLETLRDLGHFFDVALPALMADVEVQDGAGEPVGDMPAPLVEFLAEMEGEGKLLTPGMVALLRQAMVLKHGRPPRTKDDWRGLYLVLHAVLEGS